MNPTESDEEIEALRIIVPIMNNITADACKRILQYLAMRYINESAVVEFEDNDK